MRKVVLMTVVALVTASSAAAQTYLVVIQGIGGEAKFRDRFGALSSTLVDAAAMRYQIAPERVLYLAEREDTPGAHARSTKASIEEVFAGLADVAPADARIFVIVIGHGSALGGSPTFQIPGPDIAASDFATLFGRFPTQEIVFVALSSASGGFIPVLSGPRRTVITATKSDFERNETVFPIHFVEALTGDGADVDKDDRVSVLEAFAYARREVERVYAQDNRLQTEHALIDDNGDGEGTGDLGEAALDGHRARTMFLTDQTAVIASVNDPELARLLQEQRRLESQLAQLRARKAAMDADAYQRELEGLLLEIARVGRAIRERQGTDL